MYSTSKPPSTIDCAYCGETTPHYQLVSQVPKASCPQSFIFEQLRGINDTELKADSYICFEHQETFRIKHALHQRSLPHVPTHTSKWHKHNKSTCCVCKSIDSPRFVLVSAIQSLALRNYIINEANIFKLRTTRSGTGVSEVDALCNACYQKLRRKHIDVNYSPKKPCRSLPATSAPCLQPAPHLDETPSSSKEVLECVVCGKSKKDGVWTSVSELHRCWLSEIRRIDPIGQFGSLEIPEGRCRMHGAKGRARCAEKLWKEVRNLACCCICNLSLTPENEVIKVDSSMRQSLKDWLVATGKDPEKFYKDEIHRKCCDQVNSSTDANRVELLDGETESCDRFKLMNDLLREAINEKIVRQVPIQTRSLFEEVIALFEATTEDWEVEIPTPYELDQALSTFCIENSEFRIHKKSKKHGNLLYSEEWDLIQRCYELAEENEAETSEIQLKKCHERPLANDFFASVNAIRESIKAASKLCEMYSRYPETLQTLKMEDLIFTGVRVNSETEDSFIPPVDPLLFNFLFYITCSDKDAKRFQSSFDPTWEKIFVESYTKQSKSFYGRVLSILFNMLHLNNEKNTYPFQILMSDLIANTPPTTLMELLNDHRQCASPSAYDTYKTTIASHVKHCKMAGVVLGLDEKLFTVLHADNLENYSKHSRNPAKALTSVLVLGAQQPLPKEKAMALKEVVDLLESCEIDGKCEDDVNDQNVSNLLISEFDESSASLLSIDTLVDDSMLSEMSQNDTVVSQIEDSSEENSSDSQEFVSSQESFQTPALKELPMKRHTRSSSPSRNSPDVLSPREAGLEIKPRVKRLKLGYQTDHIAARQYTIPNQVDQDSRKCDLSDFLLTENESSLIDELNNKARSHALLQMAGVTDFDGKVVQSIPSLKEVEAWAQPIMGKTQTAYLDLIPGKPDTLES